MLRYFRLIRYAIFDLFNHSAWYFYGRYSLVLIQTLTCVDLNKTISYDQKLALPKLCDQVWKNISLQTILWSVLNTEPTWANRASWRCLYKYLCGIQSGPYWVQAPSTEGWLFEFTFWCVGPNLPFPDSLVISCNTIGTVGFRSCQCPFPEIGVL